MKFMLLRRRNIKKYCDLSKFSFERLSPDNWIWLERQSILFQDWPSAPRGKDSRENGTATGSVTISQITRWNVESSRIRVYSVNSKLVQLVASDLPPQAPAFSASSPIFEEEMNQLHSLCSFSAKHLSWHFAHSQVWLLTLMVGNKKNPLFKSFRYPFHSLYLTITMR